MRPRFSARLLFAAIGAIACLMAAFAMEGILHIKPVGNWLNDHETRLLLYFFPHRNETERRLQEANAKTGDVEITLTWNNLNDLDLHCIDPTGEHIFYGHKQAQRSKGELDVDRNAGPPYTNQPVEHIYWPRGLAPSGRYQVYVDHYARHGGSDPTAYQVIVKEYGHTRKYNGTISFGFQRTEGIPGRFICEIRPHRGGFEFAGLPAGFWKAVLFTGLWSLMLTAFLTTALLAGLALFYRIIYRRPFLKFQKALPLAAGCLIWGFLAGGVGQAVYSLLPTELLGPHPTYSHLVGLMLLGGILGMGLGGRIPHLPRFPSFFIAMLAGIACGRLFLMAVWAGSQMGGRLLSATLLGAAIGLMISLIVQKPEPPEEMEDDTLDGMRPLTLRANRIGPAGKLRRAGGEPVSR